MSGRARTEAVGDDFHEAASHNVLLRVLAQRQILQQPQRALEQLRRPVQRRGGQVDSLRFEDGRARRRVDARVDERDPDLLPFRCELCAFRCRSLLPPLRCMPEGLPLDFREPFPNERGVDLCSRDFERITSRGC